MFVSFDIKSLFANVPVEDVLQFLVIELKQVKPVGFEAPRDGAYNNRKHLKQVKPLGFDPPRTGLTIIESI